MGGEGELFGFPVVASEDVPIPDGPVSFVRGMPCKAEMEGVVTMPSPELPGKTIATAVRAAVSQKPIQPKPQTSVECARDNCPRPATVECKIGEKSFRLCADCANVVLHVVGLERRVRVKAE